MLYFLLFVAEGLVLTPVELLAEVLGLVVDALASGTVEFADPAAIADVLGV